MESYGYFFAKKERKVQSLQLQGIIGSKMTVSGLLTNAVKTRCFVKLALKRIKNPLVCNVIKCTRITNAVWRTMIKISDGEGKVDWERI